MDIPNPFLTVKENIEFSAKLRSNKIDIQILGLYSIKDNLISKGISGGQIKRLSITMELVSAQKIFFLDEPTTGLDSLTALNLINYLQTIKDNKTIIATIHQPSSDIFFFI